MLAAAPAQGEANKVSPSRLNCLAQLEDEFSCAICLEVCVRPCTTACGHNFCRGCLRQALEVECLAAKCPKCRAPLPHRGQEALVINTTLWNAIQLLFPGAGTSKPLSPAATTGQQCSFQHSSQAAPAARAPTATMGAFGPFIPPRPAAREQPPQPPRLAASPSRRGRPVPATEVARHQSQASELEALISTLTVGVPAPRSTQLAAAPAEGTDPRRPWMRSVSGLRPQWSHSSTSSGTAASQESSAEAPQQPGVIPSVRPAGSQQLPAARPANPFARTMLAVPRAGRGGATAGASSTSSSRSSSPEGLSRASMAPATAAATTAVAMIDLTGSSSSEDEEEQVRAAPPAGRSRPPAVQLPDGAVGEGEEDDSTPTDAVIPVHGLNPVLPDAPIRTTRASRLGPSPVAQQAATPLPAALEAAATDEQQHPTLAAATTAQAAAPAAGSRVLGLRRSQAPSRCRSR